MLPFLNMPSAAEHFARFLDKKFGDEENAAVYLPMSSEGKMQDLILAKHEQGKCSVVTVLLVSAEARSAHFEAHKSDEPCGHEYYANFKRFQLPETDFIALIAGYFDPDEEAENIIRLGGPQRSAEKGLRKLQQLKKANTPCKQSVILLFTRDEMKAFLDNLKTNAGRKGSTFGFAFDKEGAIYQTKGSQGKKITMDKFRIENRLDLLSDLLRKR